MYITLTTPPGGGGVREDTAKIEIYTVGSQVFSSQDVKKGYSVVNMTEPSAAHSFSCQTSLVGTECQKLPPHHKIYTTREQKIVRLPETVVRVLNLYYTRERNGIRLPETDVPVLNVRTKVHPATRDCRSNTKLALPETKNHESRGSVRCRFGYF